MTAVVRAIRCVVPRFEESNETLHQEVPEWDVERISKKAGILARRIVNDSACASDLAFAAAENLLSSTGMDRSQIDMLLFCTQSPDYVLPTTACILQDRLGLPTSCGALDFNQGCSGYIYGLQLARALITSNAARNVLLLTADTYSRYVNKRDRAVRPLFGDAGSATLVSSGAGASIGKAVLGTDGSGANNLIVPAGGARNKHGSGQETVDETGSTRTDRDLYMNGAELFNFTLKRVPEVVNSLLAQERLEQDKVDWFIMHQANAFMNTHLVKKLGVAADRAPIVLEKFGNTVSSTIPIVLCESAHRFRRGDRMMLVGFGVGYSWGALMLEWGQVDLAPVSDA